MAPSSARPRRDPRGPQPGDAARGLQHVRGRPGPGRGAAPRGRRLGRATAPARSARSAARRGRSAGASRRTRTRRRLRTHDRFGNRIDEVEFHPAWHELLGRGSASACTRCPGASRSPAPTSPAAAMFIASQAEAGVGCPISMTYSVIPALRKQPELAAEWEPRFISLLLRRRGCARRPTRPGALCGMGMTEKQGGSDVRANTTTATPLNGGGPGGEYELNGHKWFMSAPMCDAFLVLAQAEGGLSCFLHAALHPRRRAQPRSTSSGSRTSSATAPTPPARSSSAAPGRGWSARRAAACRRSSRWSTTPASTARLGAAAGMRCGVANAIHHAQHRAAFGKLLIDQPLMRNVLADLAIESEAATISLDAPGARLRRSDRRRRAGDRSSSGSPTRSLKYWLCKRAPAHAAEALECFGGNGFVEESGMPRLYRESPLNSIWEGSGNVQCLDVLRAMVRGPAGARGVLRRGRRGRGRRPARSTPRPPRCATSSPTSSRSRRARGAWSSGWRSCSRARSLVRFADPAVADAFCASRLGGDWGRAFGTLPAGTDFGRIIERHAVAA